MIPVLAVVLVILFFGPITNYTTSTHLFRLWLVHQVESQSLGKFTYETISGTVEEMTLTGVKLEPGPGRLLKAVDTPKLIARFERAPLWGLRLKLTEVEIEGGKIETTLASAKSDNVALPLGLARAQVRGVALRVENFSGWTLELDNVTFDKHSTPDRSDLTLKATHARIGKMTLENVEATVAMQDEKVDVSSLRAALFGGQLNFKGSLSTADGNSFQNTSLQLEGFETATALTTLGYSQAIQGKASLDIPAVSGTWTPSTTDFRGKGKVDFEQLSAKAELPVIPGFDNSAIFQALRPVAGLTGAIDFELQGASIVLSPTTLQHPQAQLEIQGTIKLDKTLALDGRLLASPALAEGIPSMGKNLFDKDPEGRTVIPYKLVGTTDAFKADIGSILGKVFSNPLNFFK